MNMTEKTKKIIKIASLFIVLLLVAGCTVPTDPVTKEPIYISLETTFEDMSKLKSGIFDMFLTYPLAQAINFLSEKFGVFGGITAVTLIINLILLIFTFKSSESMQKMQMIQKEKEEIIEKFEKSKKQRKEIDCEIIKELFPEDEALYKRMKALQEEGNKYGSKEEEKDTVSVNSTKNKTKRK